MAAAVIADTITLTASTWSGMLAAQRAEYAKRNRTFEEAGNPYPSLRLRDVRKLVDYWNTELGRRFPDPPPTAEWKDEQADTIEPWREAWEGALEMASSLEQATPGLQLLDEELPLEAMPRLWDRTAALAALMDSGLAEEMGPFESESIISRIPRPYTLQRRRKKKKKKPNEMWLLLAALYLLVEHS